MEHLVVWDHLDHLDQKATEVNLERMVLKVTLDCQVFLEWLVSREELVKEAYLDRWDHLARMEMLAHEVALL